eukprot:CFRG1591T1
MMHGGNLLTGDNQRFVAEYSPTFSDVDIHHVVEEDHRKLSETSQDAESKQHEGEEAKFVYVNFEVHNGFAIYGETYFVVGDNPVLGDWNLANGVEMKCVNYPTWKAEGVKIYDVLDRSIEWKVVRAKGRSDPRPRVQPGFNNKDTIRDRIRTCSCDLGSILLNEIDYLREKVATLENEASKLCVVCKQTLNSTTTFTSSGHDMKPLP